MNSLYDWLFHYNPYTNSWVAFKKEDYINYFNGNHENVIKSKSQKTLEEIITSNDGNLVKIKKFIDKIK